MRTMKFSQNYYVGLTDLHEIFTLDVTFDAMNNGTIRFFVWQSVDPENLVFRIFLFDRTICISHYRGFYDK